MNAWSLLSKMWKYICLPRSEGKALNKRGLEQSSVTGAHGRPWIYFPTSYIFRRGRAFPGQVDWNLQRH